MSAAHFENSRTIWNMLWQIEVGILPRMGQDSTVLLQDLWPRDPDCEATFAGFENTQIESTEHIWQHQLLDHQASQAWAARGATQSAREAWPRDLASVLLVRLENDEIDGSDDSSRR